MPRQLFPGAHNPSKRSVRPKSDVILTTHETAIERWAPYPLDPRYLVSDMGRVKGVRGVILRTPSCKYRQYRLIHSSRGGRQVQWFVHTLVLETFVGPKPESMVCRHLDGDPTNNRLTNLRWGTYAENAEDAVKHGRMASDWKHGGSKLTQKRVNRMRQLRLEGVAVPELARRFKVSARHVYNILSGSSW